MAASTRWPISRSFRPRCSLPTWSRFTSRIEKLDAGIKKPGGKRDEQLREMDLMNRLKEALENEKPIAGAVSSEAEAKLLRSFAFLSIKPQLVAINCDEQAAATGGPAELSGVACIQLSAKIESELSQLPEAERAEFLADLGLPASASDRMVRACYSKLNLISFLTAGEDECRAWTIPAGTDAVTAAGAIHSDIARGFIRAETVHFDDLHADGRHEGRPRRRQDPPGRQDLPRPGRRHYQLPLQRLSRLSHNQGDDDDPQANQAF